MQRDHAVKKLNFDLKPTPRVRGGGGIGVCGQTICCHVAALVNTFKLTYNMTMF